MLESVALQNMLWQEAFAKNIIRNTTPSSTILLNNKALMAFSHRQFPSRVLKNICFAT